MCPRAELRAAITVLSRDEVVTHLFAVTSGLESIVVGEDEIAGQVGRALQRAREDGTTSSDLEQLFQRATQTSRGVKTRTAVGGAGRSLVRLALELASSRIPDWSLTRVLIVGTGQYAATTVAAVRDRGATMLGVYSPSGRGDAFGAKYGVTVHRDLAGAMLDADVIITCTSTTVIGTSAIIGDQRRLVIDLGMPRNVDPAIVSLPGITLLDLETISLHAPIEELTATADARELVSDAAARYSAERSIEPAIVALRTHIFDLLDVEIERARKRGATPETEAALRHLASVLLHTPVGAGSRGRTRAATGRRSSTDWPRCSVSQANWRPRSLARIRGLRVATLVPLGHAACAPPCRTCSPSRSARSGSCFASMTIDDTDDVFSYQSRDDVCRYLLFEPRTREEVAERMLANGAATTLENDGDYLQLALELPAAGDARARVIGDLYFTIASRGEFEGRDRLDTASRLHGPGVTPRRPRARCCVSRSTSWGCTAWSRTSIRAMPRRSPCAGGWGCARKPSSSKTCGSRATGPTPGCTRSCARSGSRTPDPPVPQPRPNGNGPGHAPKR